MVGWFFSSFVKQAVPFFLVNLKSSLNIPRRGYFCRAINTYPPHLPTKAERREVGDEDAAGLIRIFGNSTLFS